jgi:putative nucleotidyltransferase with HDIG domain
MSLPMLTASLSPAAASPGDERVAHLFRHHAAPALRGLLLLHRQTMPGPDWASPAPPAPAAGPQPVPVAREQLRQSLQELPALPRAALQALAALRDDDSSTEHCAALIGHDPALAARTLRLANSSLYGAPGRVNSVRDAVNRLGRQTVSSVLTLATLSRQFEGASCPGFSYAGFWRHALGVALATRGLARALDRSDEPAFTVGLLHDIGRLALAVHFPQATSEALCRGPAHAGAPQTLEREVLGADHLEVGAQVAAQWNFPPEILVAIAGHHTPRGAAGGAASLADLVHVADAIAHALDCAGDPHERVPPIDAAAWARLALDDAALLKVLAETEAGVIEFATAMGL